MREVENTFHVSLGSNVVDARYRVGAALRRLADLFDMQASSALYDTPALNPTHEPYVNAVARCATDMSLDEATMLLKDLERELGRTPESKGTGRVAIDLDLVVWNGHVERVADFSRSYFTQGYFALEPSLASQTTS